MDNIDYHRGQVNMGSEALEFHITKALMVCNILLLRKERISKLDTCCQFLSNDETLKFCATCDSYFVKSYLGTDSLKNNICNRFLNTVEVSNQHFEIYNQKKKRKSNILRKRIKRSAKFKAKESSIMVPKLSNTTMEPIIHDVTKRSVNDTGNSTIPGMPDWEAILQMQYSKDPQWALICVVFVSTLILVCVWNSGMCREERVEYIDPVQTHNLKPELVKDVVARKAKFLAWFKYMRERRKEHKRSKRIERKALLSSDEDEQFESIEIDPT